MFVHYTQDVVPSSVGFPSRQRLTAVSIVCGLLLGFVLAWVLPVRLGLAPWLLGLAISLVAGTLLQARTQQETAWGMAIVGQLLGVVAIGLFFLSTLG